MWRRIGYVTVLVLLCVSVAAGQSDTQSGITNESQRETHTFNISSGSLTVAATNAACHNGVENGRVTGRQVNSTGEGYRVDIGGYIPAATPCSSLAPNVSEKDDRIVLDIGTVAAADPCDQCTGQLYYRVSSEFDRNFTLAVRHEGRTQTVVERPMQYGGMLGVLVFLLELLLT